MSDESKAAPGAVSGRLFIEAMAVAAVWVERSASALDAINVFPVPDGDTGANLSLTLRAAIDAAGEKEGSQGEPPLGQAAAAVARGALLGARGNSGVILSQWLRGFAEAVEGGAEAGGPALAVALETAAGAAGGAISEPREGTMITVAEAVGVAVAGVAADVGPAAVLEQALVAARAAVAKTPEQMPLLAEAGVVDAGGEGLALVLEGILHGFTGAPLPAAPIDAGRIDKDWLLRAEATAPAGRYGFCTEFNVVGSGLNAGRLRAALEALGDSVVVAESSELLHAHVHTAEPESAFAAGAAWGAVRDRKADDMHAQHEGLLAEPRDYACVAVIAVAAGEGFAALFRDLGATVVDGGSTFNPDAASLLAAARGSGCPDVIVLPNHRNVIPAAEQAATLSEDVRLHVLATQSMPTGIAAMLARDEGAAVAEAIQAMTSAIGELVSGAVTHAARAVRAPLLLHEGQPFALVDDDPSAGAESDEDALTALVEALRGRLPGATLLTLYCGAGLGAAEAEAAAAGLRAGTAAGLEVEATVGGQPHYPFLVSLE